MVPVVPLLISRRGHIFRGVDRRYVRVNERGSPPVLKLVLGRASVDKWVVLGLSIIARTPGAKKEKDN